jgi:hypothetical protein
MLAALPIAAQIARPQLGYALDSGGALRPVIGVAAAASWGDAALDHASSFACSAKLCLAKSEAGLISFAPGIQPVITPAPAGPALIAIEDRADAHAWIYFTESRQFALWQDGALEMLDYSPYGEILSIRAASGGFDYVIARRTTSSNFRRGAVGAAIEHYSTSDGSITVVGPAIAGSAYPRMPSATSVMLIDGGVLAASSDELVLMRPDGQQTTFPLLGAQAFYSAGKGTVEIVAAEGLWILQTDPGREQLSMLPGLPAADAAEASR